jgi:hypothetical protein
VAIGTEAGAPMVVRTRDDSSDYVRDLSGAMVISKISLISLISPKRLAELHAPRAASDRVASAAKVAAKIATTIRLADEWFWVPLGLAFLTANAGLSINTRKGFTIKKGVRSLAKTETAKERKIETVQQGRPA